ncbi:MAG: AAA family ATPase [Pasteurella oralis]|uniref:AAA family ATPase n=1 Tax=Pasteurella oralis TaxID=1071947 RepID=UPI002708A171|nr:AAA family ATPase [Pasteurella oralis]
MKELFLISVRMKKEYTAPAILQNVFPLEFNNLITIITGENGSGKSTLLEAIAINLGCPAEGGTRNFNYMTESTHDELHKEIILSKRFRPNDIFFYRAESFYNFSSEIRKLDAEYSFDPEIKQYYGGRDLHRLSHGESMEALYSNKFKPKGLYILDEPEASLSAQKQLNFISRIFDLANKGSQFIIATHSPLIMSIPDCDLLFIKNGNIAPVTKGNIETFSIYKRCLNDDNYIKNLLV